jgi:hypothetical protein
LYWPLRLNRPLRGADTGGTADIGGIAGIVGIAAGNRGRRQATPITTKRKNPDRAAVGIFLLRCGRRSGRPENATDANDATRLEALADREKAQIVTGIDCPAVPSWL